MGKFTTRLSVWDFPNLEEEMFLFAFNTLRMKFVVIRKDYAGFDSSGSQDGSKLLKRFPNGAEEVLFDGTMDYFGGNKGYGISSHTTTGKDYGQQCPEIPGPVLIVKYKSQYGGSSTRYLGYLANQYLLHLWGKEGFLNHELGKRFMRSRVRWKWEVLEWLGGNLDQIQIEPQNWRILSFMKSKSEFQKVLNKLGIENFPETSLPRRKAYAELIWELCK